MQLVAYGAQDVYLTGSPQITFFKVVYRRHTNFSVEPIPQTFTGSPDFGKTVTCTINRNGDLITNMYVNIELPVLSPAVSYAWGFVRRLGLAIIQQYKIEIGGSKLDEQYGDWLNIWYELSHKTGQERGYARMIGDVPELTGINTSSTPAYQLYVPLQFWFNRNNGLALPLIALQYHDVRITIIYSPVSEVINYANVGLSFPTSSIHMGNSQLIIDYIYLDSEERKRFAQASHEYLFEQLQFTGAESLSNTNNKYRLNFNHPSKYLVWAPHLGKYTSALPYAVYSPTPAGSSEWKTQLDNFAKLMWIATRQGVTVGATPNTWTVQIPTNPAGGDVAQPTTNDTWVNASVINKYVKAQFLFSTTLSGGATTFPANIENVVLLENSFAIDDVSYGRTGNADLLSFVNSGASIPPAVTNFMNYNSILVTDQFNYGNNLDGTDNPCVQAKLQLNGSDRFQTRDGYYFNYVQPWQHFTNTPADGINVYSFALKPEEHQPSGTCNFSRIDNATLQVWLGENNTTGTGAYGPIHLTGGDVFNIYTVNYNVLRVMAGMAGAAYSN